ncbi:MAG: CCA tRNA nucleotidyltransferase, partial [Dehalococcoidia bacterium]|nr:CCA tRNA nucleotidyltransferase [Dehalococcoidia bacterium]
MAADRAGQLGLRIYLVGGFVRDILLNRTNLDIDLTVEGNALALAQDLAKATNAGITVHGRFGTARLKYPDFVLDLAMARKETYPHPGSLPVVQSGSIEEDLFRRDFTINAMAISLNPGSYGALVDPYGGRSDLEAGIIRILHSKSFIDDATRIWRAIRYEQRLCFRIEPTTLYHLRNSLAMLDTISADRLRHEFDRVLEEETPEKILQRAWSLGVLQHLHPSLKADRWLSAKYRVARKSTGYPMLRTFYTALLAYRLDAEECDTFITRLNFPSRTARVIRDTVQLRMLSQELRMPSVSPGRVYELVNGHETTAILVAALATDSVAERRRLKNYLRCSLQTRLALNGRDLQALGVPAGQLIGRALRELLKAKLDGRVRS